MWRIAEKQNKWLDVENYENDHENGMGLYTHRWLGAILQQPQCGSNGLIAVLH